MQEQVNHGRRRFLGTAAMAAVATQFGAIGFAKPALEVLHLNRASTWLNSQPPIDRQLQGKVVLVEFWTYSCINWRRQLPYVRAWADKYRNHGLVVVGVRIKLTAHPAGARIPMQVDIGFGDAVISVLEKGSAIQFPTE
jgi:thiol-disulfide isomerase/thioredoxin